MLRGQPRIALKTPLGAASLPPSDCAFSSEPERPPGIRFYRARESFFLPYSLLQAMQWSGERLILTFVHDQVEIEGQGLHALYVGLAEFKVARIREQKDSEDLSSENNVHVTNIKRQPRE